MAIHFLLPIQQTYSLTIVSLQQLQCVMLAQVFFFCSKLKHRITLLILLFIIYLLLLFWLKNLLIGISGEVFQLFLGVDPGVRVSFRKFEEHGRQHGLLRRSVSSVYSAATVIKNAKNQPITIIVVDQYPISGDDRVKVSFYFPITSLNRMSMI